MNEDARKRHYATDLVASRELTTKVEKPVSPCKRTIKELLRLEQEKVISILDAMAFGVYIVNRQHDIEYVNPELAKQFGNVNTRMCYEYLHNRKTPCPECKNDVVFGEDKTIRWERYYENTGRTYELIDTPFGNSNGSISKLEIFIDVTERKRAEKALRESERFSSTLLNHSPNPILVMNPDTSIRYVNPALEQLTGFSSSEVVGSRVPYPWWSEETLDKNASDLRRLMSGRVVSVEEVLKKKDGERFSVDTTFVPVKSGGETKYCISSWIDITEQKQLRGNMQLYIGEAIRAQEEVRKRIARDLHDETAQSLASLYIDIEEMITMNEQLPMGVLRQLEQLKVEISNAVEEIRRFSHQLRPAVLDRFGLIASIELLLEEVKNKGQLNCHMKVIGSQIRLPIETELALFRIVQEALCNIKKHSKATEAGVTIEFLNGKIRLTISDNGKGFKVPKVLGNLACKGKVGLIGIQERVRLLNGSWSLTSKMGKGTVVALEVPG